MIVVMWNACDAVTGNTSYGLPSTENTEAHPTLRCVTFGGHYVGKVAGEKCN